MSGLQMSEMLDSYICWIWDTCVLCLTASHPNHPHPEVTTSAFNRWSASEMNAPASRVRTRLLVCVYVANEHCSVFPDRAKNQGINSITRCSL